jgi:galactose mutarotase-like enzyme
MTTLENEYLKVTVRPKGAELVSLFNKENNIEHLWQADPDIWGWNAPNLFPVVGGCINDQIIVDGNTYPMNRHGFARHSDFVLSEFSNIHAKFSLTDSVTTQESYPYKFTFQVIYQLRRRQLQVVYKVINDDDQTIHFSAGGHPAFNVPFSAGEEMEDYYLEFETEEPLVTHLLSPAGFFSGEVEAVPLQKNKLPLTPELFSKDALVFKSLRSKSITLKSRHHAHSIYVKFPDFPYLGLWAKPGAPFVCIEPWIGCADTEGKVVEFAKKEGMHSLEKGHVFEAGFIIGVD